MATTITPLPARLDEKVIRYRAMRATGDKPSAIAKALSVTPAEIDLLENFCCQQEVRKYSGPVEEAFANYAMFMGDKIRDLKGLYDKLIDENQGSAAVGAVNAQANLYDRIVKRGTALGIMKTGSDEPDETLHLTDEGLAVVLHSKLMAVKAMISSYKGIDMSEVTVEPPAMALRRQAAKDSVGKDLSHLPRPKVGLDRPTEPTSVPIKRRAGLRIPKS